MSKHPDEASKGVEALKHFASEFGDSPYSQLVMEIVLEELFGCSPADNTHYNKEETPENRIGHGSKH